MPAPKPIKLTQVDTDDYSGPEPKPYVVVGPVPGGGESGIPIVPSTGDLNTYTESGAFLVIQDALGVGTWPANFPTTPEVEGAFAPVVLTVYAYQYDVDGSTVLAAQQALNIPLTGAGYVIEARDAYSDDGVSFTWSDWSAQQPNSRQRTAYSLNYISTSPYSVSSDDDGAILFTTANDVEFTLHNTGVLALTIIDPSGTCTFTSDSAISVTGGKSAAPAGINSRMELLGLGGNWLLSGDLADETP